MGSVGSRQLNPVQLCDHQQATGLSAEQLEQLHTRFSSLDRHQRGYLTPTDLLRIPQLSLNPLHRQIIDGFFPSRDPSARIGFKQFVDTCSTILVPQFGRGSVRRRDGRVQKLHLLSKMFDTRRSGCITRSDFRQIMRCIVNLAWSQQQDQERQEGLSENRLPEVEAELQLLEHQAFGLCCDHISYGEFEKRLLSADVDRRLSIAKWLEDDDEAEAGMGLPVGSGP
ncbi:calcineurin B homologous protein 1 [Drosophila mauritiana]|uniref:Calcineurin B homologous protein 1 n=1 Tax=Drosophila mauritiana TaxID=7226 RepID=A0A6P8KLE2_DROMA|nr:calcineurin B homologous protein 1 [Drosophila mauritiana]